MNVRVALAEGRESVARCFEVMRELRTGLTDVETFIDQVIRQQGQGYRLAFVEAGGEVCAAAGFRDCESCHGASGRGDGAKLLPVLGGQHRAYLERQMRDTVEGRRPNMDAGHATLLRRSSPADIAGMADYLSRIRRAP